MLQGRIKIPQEISEYTGNDCLPFNIKSLLRIKVLMKGKLIVVAYTLRTY